MGHAIALVTLVVRDYGEAIAFFTEVLRFAIIEDTPVGDGKRWVVIAPPDGRGAATPEQAARVGDQTGGRVALFLHTDSFWDDYRHMQAHGVRFVEAPRRNPTAEWSCSMISTATSGTWCNPRNLDSTLCVWRRHDRYRHPTAHCR